MDFRKKNVLLFGLGLLGGGVATANWLIKHGAKLTVTDLKSADELAASLKALKGKPTWLLGGHDAVNVEDYDAIVLNPGVSVKEKLIQKAIKLGTPVVNEATVFYENWPGTIIGITGTRGKTTTATWTAHLMGKQTVLAGNSPEHAFLSPPTPSYRKRGSKGGDRAWAVTEMSSFSLELFEKQRKPDVAVITNIYQDHFNRYKNYRDYVQTKAHLFVGQAKSGILILNDDNQWAPFLTSVPHQSTTWFFSLKKLPEDMPGAWYENGIVYFREGLHVREALHLEAFAKQWGTHNVENLMAASLAAHAAGVSWEAIQGKIKTIPQVAFRQEIIYRDDRLMIINDTAATSPEGCIAAVKRFGGPATVLITGGTDRRLNFTKWAKIIPNYIVPEHIVLLEGSATAKMTTALKTKIPAYPTLRMCLEAALSLKPNIILFSPASKSFEKFTNEYDRGAQFNKLVKGVVGSHMNA